ncbi:MAG TPA: type IV pilus secretin PilQ [Hydrogenophaga sp.]|uniref:type IV pilus secretin PilQ n=1 Tax=Hydrogenophaga sp. TaxID=1904254 RepID=UPI002C9A82E1|nr:type IV pilus secretin PilQ [Hydrogenophaga sp.]HMN94364.1 type IV pilus secretin PilQ [Hydrogenophaga sp.]
MAVLGLGAAWAHAQNAIQSITGSMQGGSEVLRIQLAEPLTAVPSGFTIQSPARIALDFPGVVNAVGRNAVELNQGNLRSANVVQAGDRTRVVINLRQPASYEASADGRTLLVVLGRTEATTTAASAPSVFAESRNRDVAALRDIDFRRGAGNTGRVVVELGSNQVGVDIRQQGQNLVVDFLKTSLPEGLRRRLDVTDFGTPVQTITTTQVGDRVRMQVTPRGNWEHSAYQSDNQFVLEVREQAVDPSKLTQGPGYSGEKLSLNFQNIEIRALLQVIADFTNFNVVTSDSVSGSVTLRLRDVPWDQALDIILQAKGLGMRKTGNVLWIAPNDEIAAREKQELEARAAVETLESVRTQAFQMNYAKATDVAAQIMGSGAVGGGAPGAAASARILSPRGSAIAEPRTNQLFVTDIPSRLEQVQQLIARLDIPVRQVLIEARIVEADDRFGRSIGVRLGGSDLRGVRGGDPGYSVGGSNRLALGGSYNAISSTTGESVNVLDTINTSFVNLPSAGAGGFAPAAFAVSLFSAAANRFLNLEISALEADGRGKIVSSPRIVTADQVKAMIEQGTEFPYQEATSSGATSVAFRKASLKLEVTPQITPEGNIIMDVAVNKDSRGETTAAGVAINTKAVQTQVLVENGGTVVIGGIFELTEIEDVTKVPLLGDIPVLGNLFKNRSRTANKSELLVFLTPRVITDRGVTR